MRARGPHQRCIGGGNICGIRINDPGFRMGARSQPPTAHQNHNGSTTSIAGVSTAATTRNPWSRSTELQPQVAMPVLPGKATYANRQVATQRRLRAHAERHGDAHRRDYLGSSRRKGPAKNQVSRRPKPNPTPRCPQGPATTQREHSLASCAVRTASERQGVRRRVRATTRRASCRPLASDDPRHALSVRRRGIFDLREPGPRQLGALRIAQAPAAPAPVAPGVNFCGKRRLNADAQRGGGRTTVENDTLQLV